MTAGIQDVQARVAQLQAMFSPSGSTATASSGSTSGTAFAQVLASATGDDDSGSDLGEQVVQSAKQYVGVPYRWGGSDPSTGLDCSGLTQLVYRKAGIDLPRTSSEQATSGTEVSSLSDARPGDLVFFGSPVHHVGIYVGDGKMLDAPHTGTQVRIEKVWGTPSHIRRVLPTSSGTTTGAVSTASVSTGDSLGSTPYAGLFTAAGKRYGVDPALLSAIAKAESSYNPAAVSHAGARGLMQLMPGTASSLGVNALDPASAVDGAARLMANNLRSFNGRVDLALAAYNAGAGNVRKYNGVPPFTETRNYVQRVTSYWKELR